MRQFEVSTDSTSDLYFEEIKKYEVYVSHLVFTIQKDGEITEEEDNYKSYEEYVNFYERLKAGAIAKTSILNLQSHIDLFTEMARKGIKYAVHISQGKGLSPTIDNANQAIEIVKEKYPDIHYVAIEANTTTVAEGMLVRTAIKMRDEGKSLEETVKTIEEMKDKIQHFIVVDDLMHLKRGGRISGSAAVIGSMFQLKPIIEFTKYGKLKVVRKENGTRKAYKSIIKEVKENFTFAKENFFGIIVHTNNEEGAKLLQSQIKNEFGFEPEIRIMGPIIGAHVGPHAVAFTFTSNELRIYE